MQNIVNKGYIAECPLFRKNLSLFQMTRQDINTTIINYLHPYNPERIGIFGSYARQEDSDASDIDILVSFRDTPSLLDLARIHRELSSVLGKKVDVVTESALKNKKLRQYIYNDLQIIFE
jgi:uncharacterized protein